MFEQYITNIQCLFEPCKFLSKKMIQKAKFKIILNKKPSQKYTFREGKHL